jgi:DNA gyrase/topoisomerase IV subunit A
MTKNNLKKTSGDYLLDTSREYSIYVCSNRAIPSVADGLKDSQRKAIWVIRNQAEQIKTISLAGAMINSNIYLHGDSSAADAISQLAAPYCNNVCYLEGIGNFGTKVSPTAFSAPRYTYVQRNRITQQVALAGCLYAPDLPPFPPNQAQFAYLLQLRHTF